MEVSVIIGKCQHNTLGSVENAQESECCQRKDVFSCNANSINNTTVTEIKVPSCCNGCSEGGTINESVWGGNLSVDYIRDQIVHFPLKYLEFSTLV